MREKILYLDCASGIAGDMFVASMLDLGADEKKMRKALAGIPGEPFRLRIGRRNRSGIDCCDFDVVLDPEYETHDHDMEYLFGHETGSEEDGDHSGHHDHDDHGHHHHVHRSLADVLKIIQGCEMTQRARETAEKIFRILAEAEAKAHGMTAETVHFHEVGAIDSIADIIAAAVCFDDLQVERVVVSPLFEGSGSVRCAHGILPIPVPAVANIAADSGLKLQISHSTRGEFITPTGAAIAAALRTDEELPDSFTVGRIGLGAGKREYKRPNFLRAMLIEPEETKNPDAGPFGRETLSSADGREMPNSPGDQVWMLESDIDDVTGEELGYLLERLMENGARDVHYLPVFMKKSRPAWQLQVICREEEREKIEAMIFAETTTIGIRRVRMERSVLSRKKICVQTEAGPADVKMVETCGNKRYYPEYDSVRRLCEKTGMPYRKCYRMIQKSAEKQADIS
ncbi:MAG: nickel pincer cofactor biosynthesis protein LarC [Bilifractor sp.]|jgi:uncharacterized protein (TIGR00299 family) protein